MAGFWRLITDDAVTASFGLAADEWMAQHQTPERRPMLRLYTYRSHCALVGRFQHVDTEVDRAFCAAHGIDVCRRPTGGGAILMGEDQLGIALTLPDPGEGGGVPPLRDRLGPFAQAVVEGLRALGVVAAFAGKNDVEVRGRKMPGSGCTTRPAVACCSTAACWWTWILRLCCAFFARPLRSLPTRPWPPWRNASLPCAVNWAGGLP